MTTYGTISDDNVSITSPDVVTTWALKVECWYGNNLLVTDGITNFRNNSPQCRQYAQSLRQNNFPFQCPIAAKWPDGKLSTEKYYMHGPIPHVRKWETSSILPFRFQLITTTCNVIQARVGVNSIWNSDCNEITKFELLLHMWSVPFMWLTLHETVIYQLTAMTQNKTIFTAE